MKYDPISPAEQQRIIGYLAQHPRWEGKSRKGAHVEIAKVPGPGGHRITFAVTQIGEPAYGEANTVAKAVDQINTAIRRRNG